MTVKKKVGLILVLVFLAFGTFEFATQRFLVFPSFQLLQNENAIKDCKRVVQTIQREVHHINRLCLDWAAWDNTYDFIKSFSKDYTEANLVFSTFLGNNLNLIYFYDHMGKVVWGEAYDLNTEKKLIIKRFAPNEISQDDPLFNFDVEEKALADVFNSGIIKTDKGLMLVASRPIIKSNIEGPIRGTVVMGRFLDQGLIETLSTQTEVKFLIHPINIKDLTTKFNEILNQLTDKSKFVIDSKNSDFLSIYTAISDIQHKPIALIEAKVPMDIIQKGKSTVNYAMYSLFFAALIGLVSVTILIQLIVLKPLKLLTDHTLEVVKTSDFTKTLSMKRQDEIGDLATSFNTMTKNVSDTEEKQLLLIREKQNLIDELQDALEEIKTLKGFIPICASCKKIRDDDGYWNQIESYIEKHSQAVFSHSICPTCTEKTYGNEDWYKKIK
ncbi:MAG: HAMP domain-containing protein [Desulfobacula sp.]|nr:HAMP domain-containing protein [Desulfobacula sp.]